MLLALLFVVYCVVIRCVRYVMLFVVYCVVCLLCVAVFEQTVLELAVCCTSCLVAVYVVYCVLCLLANVLHVLEQAVLELPPLILRDEGVLSGVTYTY